ASVFGTGVRLLGLVVRPPVEKRIFLLMPLVGLAVAGLAVGFSEASGKSASEVLFSGQNTLPGLVEHAAGWSVGALVLLVVCKAIAYGLSLSSFRGGPVFPSLFIGAAGGGGGAPLRGGSLGSPAGEWGGGADAGG